MPTQPDIHDIYAAAERIKPYILTSPLLESPHLNKTCGGRILIKAEPLQRTGSFKFRGAFNTLSQLGDEAKSGGVVAYSSGNHAQGVAAAAEILGMPAVIVMPSDAPEMKINNTRSYGAEVVTYDRYSDNREEIGARISAERGAVLIKPYDDPRIIAGQGTVGLEIAAQSRDLDITLDAVLAPCGGGGLISGTAMAIKHNQASTAVYSVEPQNYDDTLQSLEAGTRTAVDVSNPSICDALMAPTPGEMTFSINRELLDGGLVVSDEEAMEAMRQAFARLKLVVEPGGAVALAAVLSGKFDCTDKTICVVCSGGNVDAAFFADVLNAG
jgi:threonine dehydratase